MSDEAVVDRIAQSVADGARSVTHGLWGAAKQMTDSPIEQIFFTAFVAVYYTAGQAVLFARNEAQEAALIAKNPRWTVLIRPQVAIAEYRVDFLIQVRLDDDSIKKIVVECDGHDFHDKTKEQAARDKSRDRVLQAEGCQVFRFTGSELFRRPSDCANEIIVYIQSLIGPRFI